MKNFDHYGYKRKHGRWKRWFLGLIALGVIGSLAILLGAFRISSVASNVEQPLSEAEMVALIPKGRELALAGDCFGCHSRPNGEMGAGGVAIATPFGTVYSTNITPDKTYGIGSYTRADFHRALKDGIGKGKGNLYPAMPFVFTHVTTPADLDALYAYMMSIPAMAVPNAKNSGVFELPVRPFMNFWMLLNFPDRKMVEDPERSAAWNRGAYLVEGLAHCGACHSPRNVMMGVEFSKSLQGGFVDNMAIPDITAAALANHGYTLADLTQYLATGVSKEGTSFAGMNTVTHFSTSQMQAQDVKAIATYLLTDRKGKLLSADMLPMPINEVSKLMDKGELAQGRNLYMAACAACHGEYGYGIPHVAPALKGNAIVEMSNPETLIAVVLNGLETTTYSHAERMYAMPGFKDRLNAQEIADLLTWLRAEWGGKSVAVSPKSIAVINP